MNLLALKMLLGDRAKYIGIVLGVMLASMVITQQGSIFVGLMSRTFAAITDAGGPDIWVMDPKVQFIDDTKPMQATALNRVRGVPGVAFAAPFYKGLLRVRLDNGEFQNCNVIGLDDATLTGGPPAMVEGKVEDLRRADAVIVDAVGASTRLARKPATPGGRPVPGGCARAVPASPTRGSASAAVSAPAWPRARRRSGSRGPEVVMGVSLGDQCSWRMPQYLPMARPLQAA